MNKKSQIYFLLISLFLLLLTFLFSFKTNFLKDEILNILSFPAKLINNEEIINSENIRLNENLKLENEDLKSLLKINETTKNYISSKVINREVGFWFKKLTLDKGSKDNVKLNMKAFNQDGLIGIITDVSHNYSTLTLLTDNSYKLPVKIKNEENYVYSFFEKYEDKCLKIKKVVGIKENTEVYLNDEDNFLIGKVSKIDDYICVQSKVNFDNLNFVVLYG
jgi:hypothetical protein